MKYCFLLKYYKYKGEVSNVPKWRTTYRQFTLLTVVIGVLLNYYTIVTLI